MPFLIDTIASQIVKTGPATSAQIAKILKVYPAQVSDALRRVTAQRRYGFFITKKIPNVGGGVDANVWNIDADVYRAYTASKGRRAKPRAIEVERQVKKRIRVKKTEKVCEVPHVTPVYCGPVLTRWQPSSPYYQEAT